MAGYYPIFVNLQDKPVIVVGGGNVAYRKVTVLLEHGAIVRIISPQLVPELKRLVDEQCCFWVEKEYDSKDIQDRLLIFACTEKEEVNAAVSKDAQQSCRLINVVDDPDKCTFIVPSFMEQGNLKIAVSTGGSSPIVARQIREQLQAHYGREMEDYLALLMEWRPKIKSELSSAQKEQFWAMATDGTILDLIKKGQLSEAKGVIESCFRSLLD